ncbi:MAG: hypothetical protein ISS15_05770 [Alphaproteobacteria bacterium]|nr:hypothetical protein [Alphaproteobacteria bacterium]MBL7097148.1 hypothetical protein [Alphaproteobacteria bacterium]
MRAVLVGRVSVLFCLVMSSVIVVMRGLTMMMRRSGVMRGCCMMMLTRVMFCHQFLPSVAMQANVAVGDY